MAKEHAIPASPFRRLEKRLERVESGSQHSEMSRLMEQVMELVQSNQKIVTDIIRSNSELRDQLSRIPDRMDRLLSQVGELMEILKAASEEEAPETEPLINKIDELVAQNKKNIETNQAALTTLGIIDKRLKRLYLQSSTSGSYQSE